MVLCTFQIPDAKMPSVAIILSKPCIFVHNITYIRLIIHPIPNFAFSDKEHQSACHLEVIGDYI